MGAAAEDWDPGAYARFRGLRLRPALDLLMQVPALPAGDGGRSRLRRRRGGGGAATPVSGRPLIGVDASPAMLAKAAGHL